MTLEKFLCVHGHFYQPPREDPLTGVIPNEKGASPFPNWNERIFTECYKPNAELENFKQISFNIGPTLCEWLEAEHPDILNLIVEQDQVNVRVNGVGNAIAQPYNHTILPLANYQDKVTQVGWGIADFVHRFGRKPEGMWLPETAVDLETLGVLAQQGIEFTILAPWQAAGGNIDITIPHLIKLPGEKQITIFFYHQGLSTALSFNPNVSTNADNFVAHQLIPNYNLTDNQDKGSKFILLASDGELYGHHQPMRDLFLAHLVNGASKLAGVNMTYPALWLRNNPPRDTIPIKENTSWSCPHSLLRWKGNCDCTPGSGFWKKHLRNAMNNLAMALDDLYFRCAVLHVNDPWQLQNELIQVILGNKSSTELVNQHARKSLSEKELYNLRLLLTAQYEKQRMFTSCGWFFEDFDRIEPQNNLAYAVNAIHLAQLATDNDLSSLLVRDLHKVISQRSGIRGDEVFAQLMRRAKEWDDLKLL